jgi:hypothetical protein
VRVSLITHNELRAAGLRDWGGFDVLFELWSAER